MHQVVCKPDWNAHGRAGPVPAQRRAAEPAAEGRHRIPRLRHHREPGRQGREARHPGAALRGVARTARPCRFGGAAGFFLSPTSFGAARVRPRFARRLRRRAPRRLHRSCSPSARPCNASSTLVRSSSRLRNARRQSRHGNAVADVLDDADADGAAGGAVDDGDRVGDHDDDAGAADGHACAKQDEKAGRAASRPGFPLQSPLRSDFHCNPSRLRSLRSLRAPLAAAVRCAHRRCRTGAPASRFDGIAGSTVASSSRRRCAPRFVADLASLALAGCAGCGLRLGSPPQHSVCRR